MKYVILETKDGRKLPILFPDSLVHSFVAGAMQLVLEAHDPKKDLRPKQLEGFLESGPGKVVSAGFAVISEAAATGNSESLGVSSKSSDSARIFMGEAVSHMPDSMVDMLFLAYLEHRMQQK